MNILHIDRLKANASRLPEGFFDFVMAHGRVEGALLVLDHATSEEVWKRFPTLGEVSFNIAQLKSAAERLPEGCVDYLLAAGKVEGDRVVLNKNSMRQIRSAFPLLGHANVDLAKLRAEAAFWPEGLIDDVLAQGRVVGGHVVLTPRARKEILSKYAGRMPARFPIADLRGPRQRWPADFAEHVLKHGVVKGDWVMVPARLRKELREKFPDYAKVKLRIAELKASVGQLPPGYVEAVMAHGAIESEFVVLDGMAQKALQAKFPAACWRISTGAAPAAATANPIPSGKIGQALTEPMWEGASAPPSRAGCDGQTAVAVVNSRALRKIVVYTMVLDATSNLAPPSQQWLAVADFVVFAAGTVVAPGWQQRPIPELEADPERRRLHCKAMPHLYFPDAEYSLWLDASLQLKPGFDSQRLILESLRERDLAAFRNPLRDCCYLEALDCIQEQRADPAKIDRQMEKYYRVGHPLHGGLADTAAVLRRHSPAVRRFNEIWHAEISVHSSCDQLSFDYAARQAVTPYAVLPGTAASNPHFFRRPPSTASTLLPSPAWAKVSAAFEAPDAIILSHPRSGTHFLQASLASHPRVHFRDEFMRRYAWTGHNELRNFIAVHTQIYANKRRRLNLGIVMYQDVPMFEKIFCPMSAVKVLHLLRDPRQVAGSFARMWADLLHYGKKFKYHYAEKEEALPHVPVTMDHVVDVIKELDAQIVTLGMERGPGVGFRDHAGSGPPAMATLDQALMQLQMRIAAMQRHFTKILDAHPAALAISYDKITHNAQVNKLPDDFCGEVLDFLGLPHRPLFNALKKTG